jgi:hypothetical protein
MSADQFGEIYDAGAGERLIELLQGFAAAFTAELEEVYPTAPWTDEVRIGTRLEVADRIARPLAELALAVKREAEAGG